MSKENFKVKSPRSEIALQSWDNSLEMVDFFRKYKREEINENYQKLNFWHRAIMTTDLMDDIEFRKEFCRIVEMVEGLHELSEKHPDEEVMDTLEFLALNRSLAYQNMLDEKRKEAKHV